MPRVESWKERGWSIGQSDSMVESVPMLDMQLNMQRLSRISRQTSLQVTGSISRDPIQDFSASRPPLEVQARADRLCFQAQQVCRRGDLPDLA